MLQHDLERRLDWVYHQLKGIPCDTNMRDTNEDYAEAVKIALDRIEKGESSNQDLFVGIDYGQAPPLEHPDAIFGYCPNCDYRYKCTPIADGEPCVNCGHPVKSHLRSAKQLGIALSPASDNTTNSGYMVEVDNTSENGYTYINIKCACCSKRIRSEIIEPSKETYKFPIPLCPECEAIKSRSEK